jgi:AcrR family transcriptional regulator
MDAIRDASAVSLKRLYRLYPAKDELTEAVLRRQGDIFHAELVAYTARYDSAREQILAIFDYLHAVFSAPDYRGCPFINAFGEGHSGPVLEAITAPKHDLRAFVGELVAAAQGPDSLATQLTILINGAMVAAAMLGTPAAALEAKAAARTLLG